MYYIALKPCQFAGQSFLIGDKIPSELIHERAIARLKRVGFIVEADGEVKQAVLEAKENTFTVPVMAKEGKLEIELNNTELQTYFEVVQKNADEASGIINGITNKDLLLVIHALDSRKSIKAVAQEKAMSL